MTAPKPRKQFEDGEAVRYYGVEDGKSFVHDTVVVREREDGLVDIKIGYQVWRAHPKQLRRLKRREWRRVWIHKLDRCTTSGVGVDARILWEDIGDPDYVEFVEARPGRRGK